MKRILICMDPDGHSQKRFLMGAAEIVQPNPNWTVIFDLTPELLTLERWQQYEEDGIVGAIVCETDIPDLETFYKILSDEVDVMLKVPNLSGWCYTQLTDVEQEQNGVYCYDRASKFDMARIREIFSRRTPSS